MNLNRENWGKIYTIYTYGCVTITLQMSSFNFLKDKAVFEYKISASTNKIDFEEDDKVEYERRHMSIGFFKKLLDKSIKKSIKYRIERELNYIASVKYDDLHYSYYSIEEKDIIYAGFEEELDAINGLPDSIKENAIENLKDMAHDELNVEYNDKVSEYIEDNKLNIPDIYNFIESLKIKGD